jgi:hypothetical protein
MKHVVLTIAVAIAIAIAAAFIFGVQFGHKVEHEAMVSADDLKNNRRLSLDVCRD